MRSSKDGSKCRVSAITFYHLAESLQPFAETWTAFIAFFRWTFARLFGKFRLFQQAARGTPALLNRSRLETSGPNHREG
jgi:hypothetical protein